MGVLRDIFGPSKREIWEQLARDMNINFEQVGLLTADRVVAGYGEWTITLDTYTVSTGKSSTTFTRLRAPYVNRDGFQFTIYREGFFSKIGKFFGMQDVEVGFSNFDRDFIIQGNHEGRLRSLFVNPRLRELLAAEPEVHLSVKEDEGWFGATFPDGVDELSFQVVGVIRDLPRLKSLFDLFAETLNTLCHIGSAYRNDPGLNL